MTDLNLAYSFNQEEEEPPLQIKASSKKSQMEHSYQQLQQQSQQQTQQQLPTPPKLQMKPPSMDTSEIPMMPPRQKPVEYFGNHNNQQRHPEYSFWDRMVMSKREVLKLFILSIVIVLGISLEKIGFHYINAYLSSNDLSTLQEFMIRLSFPIIVFILLWIIKSL